jgi:transglutaminase-like putative cysteine protease
MARTAGIDRRPDLRGSAISILVRLLTYLLVGHFAAATAGAASTADADSPFAVEPEMARWARDAAGRERRPERILRRVAAAVEALGIQETELETGTAREVFHSRRANCAGFAFLVVGLARSLGVEALVVEVSDLVRSDQQGDLVIRHRHVAVGVWVEGTLWVVDREGALSSEQYRFQVLEDRTAVAIYHSNRGAELLLGGRLDGALEHLERAVEIDPGFEPAWGNLRVARRRAGSR